jgi:hypothetical protein
MFFRQLVQHLLIADSATDFLPSPPVESRFIAVDSRHSNLLRSPKIAQHEIAQHANASPKGFLEIFEWGHAARLSGHHLNREGATCCQGVFEVKNLIIRCLA